MTNGKIGQNTQISNRSLLCFPNVEYTALILFRVLLGTGLTIDVPPDLVGCTLNRVSCTRIRTLIVPAKIWP